MLLNTRPPLAGAQSCFRCGSAARLAQRARLPPAPARQGMAVLAMAKPTKAGDLRGLSDEELGAEVYKSKRALFDLRVAQKTRQVRRSAACGLRPGGCSAHGGRPGPLLCRGAADRAAWRRRRTSRTSLAGTRGRCAPGLRPRARRPRTVLLHRLLSRAWHPSR